MASVNSTAGALLGFLHKRPMTGWQLVQVAEVGLCDFWRLSPSQVYRELEKLTAGGLVEAGAKGVRDQIPYSVTAAGSEAFLEWLREDPGPESVRSPIHLKLSFAEHLDAETCDRFVRIYRRRNEERLDYYRGMESKITDEWPNARHMLRSGITFREGLLSWLDSLPWGRKA